MSVSEDNQGNYRDYVTVSDAAAILGISIDTVRRWEKSGKIHAERLDGKNRYFPVDELEAFASTQPLSTSEVAKRLNISASSVRRLEETGQLVPSRTTAGHRTYDFKDIENYLLDKQGLDMPMSQQAYIPDEDIGMREDVPMYEPSQASRQKVASAYVGSAAISGRAASQPANDPRSSNTRRTKEIAKTVHTSGFKFFQRAIVYTVAIAILLVSLFSVLLLISPSTVGNMFWKKGGSSASAQQSKSVLSKIMQPFADRALNVVDVVKPGIKEQLNPVTPTTVTQAFNTDKDGNITLTTGFSPASSSDIKIPDTKVVTNLNSEYVQGQKPGDAAGNLALLPIVSSYIKDGTIVSEDIAEGGVGLANLSPEVLAYLQNSQPAPQPVQQSSGISGVTAGPGLSGGGSSGTPTISLQTGLSTEIISGGVEVRLGTSATATTTSGSGLEISPSGLQLISGCGSGQLLKWNGSAWACASDVAGGGSFDVQEGGATVTSPVAAINFNANDFSVSDNVGQANIVVDYVNSGITRRNQNETITGTWSFNSANFTTVSATSLSGSGASITNLNVTNVSSGTLSDAFLSSNVTLAGNAFNGGSQLVKTTAGGLLPALNGSLLTNISASQLGGQSGSYYLDLGNATGTLAMARIADGSITNAKLQNSSLTVSPGTGLSGGGSIALGGSGTLNLADTAVTAGSYGSSTAVPAFTVDAQGRLTAAGSTTLANSGLQNSSLTVGAGTGLSGGGSVALGSSTSLSVAYGAAAGTAVQGSTTLTCTSGSGNLTGGGNVITLGTGGTCSGINTSAAVTFGTSVTTPLLTSVGALDVTAGSDLTLGAAGNITLAGFDCSGFLNGGVLTTDASGNLACDDDDGGAGGSITGLGTANRITLFSGTTAIASSWLAQNGTDLELDATRNFSLLGGDLSVTGAGTFSGAVSAASFSGSGAGLTSVDAASLGGQNGAYYLDLGNASGSLDDARLSNNVTLSGNAFNGNSQLVQLDGGGALPAVSGAALTGVNASQLGGQTGSYYLDLANATGTLAVARIADGSLTNSKLVSSALTVTAGAGLTGGGSVSLGSSTSLGVAYGSSANTAVQGNVTLVCPSGTGNLTGGGNTITLGSGGTCGGISGGSTPVFTSVTTGSVTNANNLSISATGASHNLSLSAGGSIILSGFNCSTFDNGGVLTTNASGILSCQNDDGGAAGTITGSGTVNRLPLYNGTSSLGDSWLLQNGSTLQLDSGSNLNLLAGDLILTNGNASVSGDLSVSGAVTLSGLSDGIATIAGGILGTGSVNLGTDTTGDYLQSLGTLTGLSATGNSGAGSTPTLAVLYGSSANTAVQGDTSLTVAAGTGLSGGATITLGSGGTATLNLDINSLTTKNTINSTDYVAVYDQTSSSVKKVSRSDFLQGITGALQYKGTWDPSTNTPTLADNTGVTGYIYAVTAPGTRDLGSGPIVFAYGDFVIHNGTTWERAPSGVVVASVFGRTGAVTAQSGDYSALQITNTPAGSIAAGTVQAALNELDAEKLGSLNGLTANSQTFANDTNVTITSAGSTHTLGWAGQLAVSRGGTGTNTFTSNGVLYGNGTGALQTTSAGASGQLLLANGSGVPTFTTLSGDVTVSATGVAAIGAGKVSNADLANASLNVNPGTGLSGGGSVSLGGSTSLSVVYGSSSNTAAQGNTALSFSGNGNLTGTVSGTAGAGFTSNTLDIVDSPTFGGDLVVLGSNGITIGDNGVDGVLSLTNATNSNLSSLQALAPTGTGTALYQLPAIGGGTSDTICLETLSNCQAIGSAGGDLTGTYPNPNIAAGAVTGTKIANNTITNGNLQTGSFGNITGVGTLGSLTVSGAINGATISGGTLSGGSVSGGSLSASAVNGLSVSGGTISVGTWNGTAIGAQYGGTGLNTSSSTGIATVSSGVWSIASSLTDAQISDTLTSSLFVGSGSTTTAIDLATAEVAGNLKATNLQTAAADLGAADVNINLGNTNGSFNTNLTLDGSITASSFIGAITGNASTATALAVDPADCSANQFAIGIVANGTATCASITDADVSNTLTSSIFIGSGSTTNAIDLGTAEIAGTLADGNVTDTLTVGASSTVADAALSANVTKLGATLTKDEITNSGALGFTWSDSEVSDTLTLGASSTVADAALSSNITKLGATLTKDEITNSGALAFNWSDSEVSDTLTSSIFIGSGSSTNAIDLATAEVAGNLKASNLQSTAADLGAADVTINLGNTNGSFNTNVTTDGSITAGSFIGAITGNASTATALAADPADCSANQFAVGIVANGTATCASIGDADVSNTLTSSLFVGSGSTTTAIDLATAEVAGNLKASSLQSSATDLGAADVNINLGNTNGAFNTNLTTDGSITASSFIGALTGNASTATALAADPTACAANRFVTDIAASGILTCSLLTDADVPDTLTIGASSTVADAALSANVTKLGATLTKDEITNTGVLGFTWSDSEVSDTLTASLFVGSGSTTSAIDLGTAEVAGTLADANVSDTLTIGASSTVADAALSSNVTKLGATLTKDEITNSGSLGFSWSDAEVSDTLTSSLFVGSGSTTTAIDLATAEVAGNLKASNLQSSAADLGAADVNINLGNTNGSFNTNITTDGSITASSFIGAVTGNASTATALAVDPTACAANRFVTDIAANGTLSCALLTDADVPDTLTIGASSTVADAALSANVTKLGATLTKDEITNSGSLAFTWSDAEVADTLTSSIFIGSGSTTNAIDLATAEVAGTLADGNVSDTLTVGASSTVADAALSANVTKLGATLTKDEITNTGVLGFTWSDSEVADTLTIGASSTVADAALSSNVTKLGATLTKDEITNSGSLAFTWSDAEVSDTLTSSIFKGSGTTTDAIDLATAEVAGNLKATNLQNAAADLGAANVTINLSNTNGSFNTNLTVDGTVTAGSGASVTGGLNNNSGGITGAGSIAGVAGLTFSSGALDLANGGITNTGSIASVSGLTFTASGTFDQSGSSGTFKTGSGAATLNGDTTVAGSHTLTVGGLATLNSGLAVTGASTFTGNVSTSNGNLLVQQTNAGATAIFDDAAGKIGSLKAGSAKFAFLFDNSGNFSIGSDTRTNIAAANLAGTDVITILGATGNVGINDTNPLFKLSVGGTLNVTGASTLAAVSVSSLRIGTSATAGYVLTTDASGNAAWSAQTVQSVYNGTTLTSGNNVIWTGSATCTTGACSAILSTNGTTGGTAIFANIFSVQCTAQGATSNTNTYYCGYGSYTAGTKTLAMRLTYAGTTATQNVSGTVYITVIGN